MGLVPRPVLRLPVLRWIVPIVATRPKGPLGAVRRPGIVDHVRVVGTGGVLGLTSDPNSVCGGMPFISGKTIAKKVPSGTGVVKLHAASSPRSARSASTA